MDDLPPRYVIVAMNCVGFVLSISGLLAMTVFYRQIEGLEKRLGLPPVGPQISGIFRILAAIVSAGAFVFFSACLAGGRLPEIPWI
ncbi:MAG TPA: hypothetical protein VGM05_01285 [Planctomycetaceae bacterium]|jgi:hypothetical protein